MGDNFLVSLFRVKTEKQVKLLPKTRKTLQLRVYYPLRPNIISEIPEAKVKQIWNFTKFLPKIEFSRSQKFYLLVCDWAVLHLRCVCLVVCRVKSLTHSDRGSQKEEEILGFFLRKKEMSLCSNSSFMYVDLVRLS